MPNSSPQPSSVPTGQSSAGGRQSPCVFCLEPVTPGALVCRHCGNFIAPIQRLADAQAALDARLVVLELTLAAQASATTSAPTRSPGPEATEADGGFAAGMLPRQSRFHWPHMADNLFLGLSALLVVHWLSSTLPDGHQAFYRLAGLVVALPFGFRFEYYSRSRAAAQVLSALVFGVLGTTCIAALDYLPAVAASSADVLGVNDAVESIIAIGLSHLTGSVTARWWRRRREEEAATAGANAAAALLSASLGSNPQELKARFDALKAIMDAGPPVTAAALTAWAAVMRLLQ